MLLNVIDAQYLGQFQINLLFNDGLRKVVDLKDYISSKKHPFFQPLKSVDEFKKFKVDRTLVWESGADVAPEYLHDDL